MTVATLTWSQRLVDLKAIFSETDIAHGAQVSRSTLWRMATDPGFQPKYDAGQRIIELHERYCPR